MNYKRDFNLLGYVLLIESALMALPIIAAVVYHEEFLTFIYSILITGVVGFLLQRIPVKNQTIYARDGFFIVTFAWLIMSVFGTLPYLISAQGIHNVIDAFFETISGLTTTGITILEHPEMLPKSLLLWRALTQWIGGMGVLVFLIAFIPLSNNDNSMHVLRAEMAGPTIDKIVPKSKNMSIWMYGIYVSLTVLEFIALVISKVPVFDAICHTLTTAATGGFSTHAESIAFFQNPAAEWVITAFMFLFGINFNVFFLLIIRKFKKALSNEELWTYIGIVLASTLFVAYNVISRYDSFASSVRQSAFQVVSVMTTTGFAVTNSGLWPVYIRMLLLFLMILGACGGSTAGGMKLSRLIYVIKYIFSNIKRLAHPREISNVTQDSKKVSDEAMRGTIVFFMTYLLLLIISIFIISLQGFDFESSLSITASALGDNGIAFGAIGDAGNVHMMSVFNKLYMSFLMLAGRLEIFPVIVLLVPGIFKKK